MVRNHVSLIIRIVFGLLNRAQELRLRGGDGKNLWEQYVSQGQMAFVHLVGCSA